MDITYQTETADTETTQATDYMPDRSALLLKHIIALDHESPSLRMEAFVALAAAGVIHRSDNNAKETGVYSESFPEHWIMAQWNLDKLEAVHLEQFRTQLILHSKSKHFNVRWRVAGWLEYLNDLLNLPVLLDMLGDSHQYVRSASVRAIHYMGDPTTLLGDRTILLRRLLLEDRFTLSEQVRLFEALVWARYQDGAHMISVFAPGCNPVDVCREYLCGSEEAAVQERAASLLPLLEQRLLLRPSNADNVTNKAELLRVSLQERVRIDNLLKVPGTDAHSSRPQETLVQSEPSLAIHPSARTAIRPLAILRTLWVDWLGGLGALAGYAILWFATLEIDIFLPTHLFWIKFPLTLLMYSLMGQISAIGFEDDVKLNVAKSQYRVRRIVTLIACLPLFWLAFR